MNSLLTLFIQPPPTKRDVMCCAFLEVVIYLGQMWQAQTPRTRCTCVSPRRSVPESASRRPSPGPRTLRRRQTTDKRAESDTRERERHLITEGGGCCHSWSDCFISRLPQVQNIYTSPAISVCTPKKRDEFWEYEKVNMNKWPHLCLNVACVETADVRGQCGDIMKVNLTQSIAVKFPQLESEVIMTDRWREEVGGGVKAYGPDDVAF